MTVKELNKRLGLRPATSAKLALAAVGELNRKAKVRKASATQPDNAYPTSWLAPHERGSGARSCQKGI